MTERSACPLTGLITALPQPVNIKGANNKGYQVRRIPNPSSARTIRASVYFDKRSLKPAIMRLIGPCHR